MAQWNKVCNSEAKQKNYLAKLGNAIKKIGDIEYAIVELRKHHQLTIESLEKAIADIVLADKRESIIKAEQLRQKIEEIHKSNVKNYIERYVEGVRNGDIRTPKGEVYAYETKRNWGQFIRVFLDFYRIHPFNWDDITKTLVDRYIGYLEEIGYMRNTLDKHISIFHTIVAAAEQEGIHTNHLAKLVIKSPTIREQDMTKEIYLTKEELQALYDMPLEDFEETVRDVFLIGCYTAQRFSDYVNINESCIGTTAKGTKVIRLEQKKTKMKVVLPIIDEKLEILLKKYEYNVPNLWGESLNRTIKKICKRLSESVPSLARKEKTLLTLPERRKEKEAQEKGEQLFEYDSHGNVYKPRWSLVCSHTARRTCITNMVLSGKWNLQQMMKISGHKKEETFNKYVKLSLDEIADDIATSVAADDGLF